MPRESAKNASELVTRLSALVEQSVLTRSRLDLLEKLFAFIDVEKTIQVEDIMPANSRETHAEFSGVAPELPVDEKLIAKLIKASATAHESPVEDGVAFSDDGVAFELPIKEVLDMFVKLVKNSGVAF